MKIYASKDSSGNPVSNDKGFNIPNITSRIEASAFANCVELTTINFTDNLKKIGQYAFSDCVELTAINGLPSTVVFEGNGDDCQFLNVKKLSLATEAQIKAIHVGNKNKHYDEKFPWH